MLLFKRAFLVLIGLTLAGCGFQPLYGVRDNTRVIEDFSFITVAPMADRLGQQLQNELERLLHPNGKAPRERYRLNAELTESKSSLAVKKSAFATRANLEVTAKYILTQSYIGDNRFASTNSITVSYNIYDSQFATLMAEKDARKRAVRELAQEIRIRLAVYLRDPTKTTPGKP